MLSPQPTSASLYNLRVRRTVSQFERFDSCNPCSLSQCLQVLSDVAKAANTLLDFSRDDQQALLEVMADYSPHLLKAEILTAMKMALLTTNKLLAQAYLACVNSAVQCHHASFRRPSRRIRRSSVRFWVKFTIGKTAVKLNGVLHRVSHACDDIIRNTTVCGMLRFYQK